MVDASLFCCFVAVDNGEQMLVGIENVQDPYYNYNSDRYNMCCMRYVKASVSKPVNRHQTNQNCKSIHKEKI